MNQVEIKRRQIESYVNILGLVALLILGQLLGNEGIAYVAVGYETMNLLWLLLGSGASQTFGRLLRSRLAKGQYRNAVVLQRNILICQCILGGMGSLGLILCADAVAEKIFYLPYSHSVLVLFAPVLVLRMASSVLAGRFQGEGSEMPPLIGAVLRQVLWVGFSFLFVNLLSGYGEKVSALLFKTVYRSMYGAMGVALALVVAELGVLVCLLLLLRKHRTTGDAEPREGRKTTDSFGDSLRVFYGNMMPECLVGLLQFLPVWTGLFFYLRNGKGEAAYAVSYGMLYGRFYVLCGIVVLFVGTLLIPVCARCVGNLRKGEARAARGLFQEGIHLAMMHSLFWAVVLAVLSKQISGVFQNGHQTSLVSMFSVGAWSVVFLSLGFFFLRILMFAGRKLLAVGCLLLTDLVYAVLVIALVKGGLGIMAPVISLLVAGILLCLGVGALCCKLMHCGIDWLKALGIPAGCCLVVGLLGLLLCNLLFPHLGNFVTILVVLAVMAVIYWGALWYKFHIIG